VCRVIASFSILFVYCQCNGGVECAFVYYSLCDEINLNLANPFEVDKPAA